MCKTEDETPRAKAYRELLDATANINAAIERIDKARIDYCNIIINAPDSRQWEIDDAKRQIRAID
jgi:hypothetical protein